jgi:hypothetical protein
MNIEISWSEFKIQVLAKSLKMQYVTSNDNYHIVAFDSLFKLYCILPIGTNHTDTIDFETNYKSTANLKIEDIDSQGRQILRVAAGQSGWVYTAHPIEFETAKLGSLFEKNYLNSSRGVSSIKFYDTNNESTIVKTVVLFKPPYDYELISGNLQQIAAPTSDVRIWVIGGIIELGGAYVKEFAGGINMAFYGANESVKTDGRAAKYMKKDIVGVPYQANQLQVIVTHGAGVQHKLMLTLEYFRA